MIPKGKALAYRDWLTMEFVFYPIGIHLLVRWWKTAVRYFYWFCGYPSLYDQRIQRLISEARQSGYEKGQENILETLSRNPSNPHGELVNRLMAYVDQLGAKGRIIQEFKSGDSEA